MFGRALIRTTLRLSSRNNNGSASNLAGTNIRGNSHGKDQSKNADNNDKSTSKNLFSANDKDKNVNNKNDDNTNKKQFWKYRNQGRQEKYRQPTEKLDHVYKKGEFNPNILSFTWMPTDPNYNLQHFSMHLDNIVKDKDYPNHRCLESWLSIIQRGEFFQPDAHVYLNFIHILVATKMPIPIDLFEAAVKATSPTVNYVPSDELKGLINNHQMLFTVIQELLANKTEDPVEPDPQLAAVTQLYEHIIESTTMLQKSNYSMVALAQMFLMHIPRTTHIWTLLFVSSSALTAEEQHKLFKLLSKSDLSLLTSQIMESLFFVSDEKSNETILQRMVELRLKPSSNFCSIYIRKLRDAKDYRRIIAFYQWMRNENIKLDGAITMTSVITSCHQTFNLDLVDSMLQDPAYAQLVNSLDTPLLNSLIYHYARKQDIEKVELFMNKLTRDGTSTYRPLVTMPTYHIYLATLAKYKGSESAINTWTAYRKTHSKFRFLSPDAFLSIISAQLKEGNPEEAVRFIQKAVGKVDIPHFKVIKAVAIAYYYAEWAKNQNRESDAFLDISTKHAELTKMTDNIFEPFNKYPREELEQLSNLVMRDLVQEKNAELIWTWFYVMKTKGFLLSFKMLMAVEEIFNELKFNQLASVVAKEKDTTKKK